MVVVEGPLRMCLLVIIFAFVGFSLRGFPGFVIGGALGFMVGSLVQAAERKRRQQAHGQFIETTFAVMGALCKADGVVTRDEIQVVEQILARLLLSPEQKEVAKAAFHRGKAADFDLDAAVGSVARLVPRGSFLFQLFLELQIVAVAADGHVHPAERAMLVRVARGLGLSEYDVARLEALLRAAAGGEATSGGPSPEQRLDDAHAALGVTPDASEDEIKRAYRKTMSENHPDRFAAKGLPDSMREIAEDRARKINAAYDLIRKARQMG
ncbi:MAG: co-chaperone DjlA [Polyangiaceae bacterium]|nr:co-chaperone DjlA [Polyangiaceae bacterium]